MRVLFPARAGLGGNPVVYPFTPPDYGTLAWWLRGDTVILNGGDVSSWTDKSGNGRHWAQATAGLQPAYSAVTAINSRPGVVFTKATLDRLAGPNLFTLNLPSAESFIVLTTPADPPVGAAGLWCIGANSSNSLYPRVSGPHAIYEGFGNPTRPPGPALAANTLSMPHIYNCWAAPNDHGSTINGVAYWSSAVLALSWATAPQLGSGDVGVGIDATICEWFVYSPRPTAIAKAAIIAGLKAYYAIP